MVNSVHHPDMKFDLLVNNLAEYFNSYILKACDKAIITMYETIRRKLMWYQLKRDGMEKYDKPIYTKILERLEAAGEESCNYLSMYASQGLFEVLYRHQ